MSGNITTFSYYTKISEIIDQKYSSLIEFFDKNDLINFKSSKDPIRRDYLIKQFESLQFETLSEHPLIDMFSSDEDSDNDHNSHFPTIKDVLGHIWDEKVIIKTTHFSEIPKKARPALIFSKLDLWMSAYDLKQFILDIPLFKKDNFIPDIDEILMINKDDQIKGFVVFYSFDHANRVYSFFNNAIKRKSVPSKNTKGEVIDVDWAYDKTDLKDSKWYAVILRNVPPFCNLDVIKTQCSLRGENVLYVVPPVQVKNQFCCLVVMENINDCEKICLALNNKEISKNKILKVNIHPKSCKYRDNLDVNTTFAFYFKNNTIREKYIHTEKDSFTLKEIREKNNEKYNKNNINLQQKIDRKYNNNKETVNHKENEDIFSKMKESLMLIKKNSTLSSDLQETVENIFSESDKIKDINPSVVNITQNNNNFYNNSNNIHLIPPVPIINQINYNNMQYIKTNQVNFMGTVKPQVPICPITVFTTPLQPNKIPQPIVTHPQLITNLAPCYITPIINANPNFILPPPLNINQIMMNNQIRYTAISPIPYPSFYPQQVLVNNPIPINTNFISGNINLHHSAPQNIMMQNNVNNLVSANENSKMLVCQNKSEILNKDKNDKNALKINVDKVNEEGKIKNNNESIPVIRIPKIENLPPLPKELKEIQKIEIQSKSPKKNNADNTSNIEVFNTSQENSLTASIVASKSNIDNKKSSIIDVKKIPVSKNSISSSSSSSSYSDEDNSDSSSDSSSYSIVTKKKRYRRISKSHSKSKSNSYKGKIGNNIGKYEKRRNKRKSNKKRSRNT